MGQAPSTHFVAIPPPLHRTGLEEFGAKDRGELRPDPNCTCPNCRCHHCRCAYCRAREREVPPLSGEQPTAPLVHPPVRLPPINVRFDKFSLGVGPFTPRRLFRP